jgi:2-amino-4-hydroxy-6-hydroxymethyldihydropteridine diphosphokinase
MYQSSSNVKSDGSTASAAVLSIGSNIGEREYHVLSAAGSIAASPGVVSARLSPLYETAPQGTGYSRPFINAVMIVETTLDARALLAIGRGLEREAGRLRGAGKGDRPLDIDIILYGDGEISEDDLTVPHPRFLERKFVLVPLTDLEPGYPLPDGSTASRAAASEQAKGEVTMVSDRSTAGRKSL